jgi:hypothetical protein
MANTRIMYRYAVIRLLALDDGLVLPVSVNLRHKESEGESADCCLFRFELSCYRRPGCSWNRSVNSHLIFSSVKLCQEEAAKSTRLDIRPRNSDSH